MSRVVGKKLRETRESLNLSLEDVLQSTHIRIHYLEAMERGDFGALPSMVQVKGFLRSYASYLGLNGEALIEAIGQDPWTASAALKEEAQPAEEDEVQASPAPEIDSATSFAEIGQTLREQREILGLSLEDIEHHTHLKIRYLKDLEAGNFNGLPSPVQGRGMLKNYVAFLGLDPDDLLLRFADGLQAQLSEDEAETQSRQQPPGPRPARRERRRFPRDIVLGVFLAISLVAFIIWGAFQVTAMRAEQEPEPTAPSIADVLLPSSTPSPIPTATATQPVLFEGGNGNGEVVEQPAAEPTQEIIYVSEDFEGPVQVQVVVRQRSWMRVTVDEDVEFDGRVIPGSAYAFAGEDYVEITTGNGAGLQVIYNDFDLGTLGGFGEIIDFVITVNGVQTPTPTLTLTSTETPQATPTPTETPNP